MRQYFQVGNEMYKMLLAVLKKSKVSRNVGKKIWTQTLTAHLKIITLCFQPDSFRWRTVEKIELGT